MNANSSGSSARFLPAWARTPQAWGPHQARAQARARTGAQRYASAPWRHGAVTPCGTHQRRDTVLFSTTQICYPGLRLVVQGGRQGFDFGIALFTSTHWVCLPAGEGTSLSPTASPHATDLHLLHQHFATHPTPRYLTCAESRCRFSDVTQI
eukprot:364539-Chlamydomonas_euryale.AAC.5